MSPCPIIEIVPKREPRTSRWVKGISGNPAGRLRGRKNKLTYLRERLSGEDADEVLCVIKEMVRKGDKWAVKFFAEHLWPRPKGRLIELELPNIRTERDIAVAHKRILTAVTGGKITLAEAKELDGLLMRRRRDLQPVTQRSVPLPNGNTAKSDQVADPWGDDFGQFEDFESNGDADEFTAAIGTTTGPIATANPYSDSSFRQAIDRNAAAAAAGMDPGQGVAPAQGTRFGKERRRHDLGQLEADADGTGDADEFTVPLGTTIRLIATANPHCTLRQGADGNTVAAGARMDPGQGAVPAEDRPWVPEEVSKPAPDPKEVTADGARPVTVEPETVTEEAARAPGEDKAESCETQQHSQPRERDPISLAASRRSEKLLRMGIPVRIYGVHSEPNYGFPDIDGYAQSERCLIAEMTSSQGNAAFQKGEGEPGNVEEEVAAKSRARPKSAQRSGDNSLDDWKKLVASVRWKQHLEEKRGNRKKSGPRKGASAFAGQDHAAKSPGRCEVGSTVLATIKEKILGFWQRLVTSPATL